jgi:InsA C-terminal domain
MSLLLSTGAASFCEILRQSENEIIEGVAKVLICYDRHRDGGNRNTRMMARRNDQPSPALPQLSRHRYCPPWEDPARQATLYRCREKGCAGRTFLLEYAYAGQSPAVKQQIVDMAMNASGIRDTARVLHISPNTVMAELKKGI